MSATFQLTCVAFVRSVGGRVRILLTVDRDGSPLFDGDPALLVEHRPGRPASTIVVEGPTALSSETLDVVVELVAEELVEVVEHGFDEQGAFDGSRMLGRTVEFVAPIEQFEM